MESAARITPLQSHVVESWSMSGGGFKREIGAWMLRDTPDMRYQFSHRLVVPLLSPALARNPGRLGYRASCMIFFQRNT